MGKEKKKEDSGNPKVSFRKNVVTGTLKHSGIELKLSVKKPKDWKVLRDFYSPFKKELYNDLFPLLQTAYFSASPKTKHKKGQHFKDIMKVQAGLLHGFLSYAIQNNKYLPSLRAIKVDANLRKQDMRNPQRLTAYFMESVYGEYMKCNNCIPFYTDEAITNFYKNYIKKGEDIIKNDIAFLKIAMSSIHSILYLMKIKKGILHATIFDFLYNLFRSIHIKYRSSIDCTVAESCENPDELDSMKTILLEIFPSLKKIIPA
jgi:hypothetical protein